MNKEKKPDWRIGLSSLSGSLMLYALSGVLVISLNSYFTKVGQVSVRALSSFTLMLIIFLFYGAFLYLKKRQRLTLKLAKNYDKKWFILELVLRPLSQISFAYATLSVVTINGEIGIFGPTSAIFYLFSSKVVFGGLIKLIVGDKEGKKKFYWYDLLVYALVLVGMYLYQTNVDGFVAGMNQGVVLSVLTGLIEAIKTKTMNVLSVSSEDRIVVSLYEFLSGAAIAFVIVLVCGLEFTQQTFTYEGLWLALVLAGAIGAGTLWFELIGFANFDADLGNMILAAELGLAPLLNIQAKKMLPVIFKDVNVDLVGQQWVGIFLLIGALFLIALIPFIKNRQKDALPA